MLRYLLFYSFVSCGFRLFIYLCSLGLCLMSAAPACGVPVDTTYTLYRISANLLLTPDHSAYQLPNELIVMGSDTVQARTRLFRRHTDYEVDYPRGIFNLIAPVDSAVFITVSYQIIPVPLSRQFFHRRLVRTYVLPDSAPTPENRPGSVTLSTANSVPSSLRATGSKTFRIETGSNRDPSLDQSLRLEISGKAARDVEVLAILSDRSNPIQSDGTTRRLNELDNVLVQVRTPSTTTTMGDQTLSLNQSKFAQYERKIKGMRSAVTLPGASLEVAAAVSEGDFTSNAMQGIEGVQGPYQLTTQGSSSTVLVVAGTEKVWVDGTPMARGADEDYVIDYTSAQITFTRNRLITGDSRIVVDFEASDQQFRKNVYLGRGSYRLGTRTQLATTLIHEGDRVGSVQPDPTANGLAPKTITVSTGGEYVGPGAGAYDLSYDNGDTLGHFVFVGPGGGSYQVNFDYVGPNQGAYTLRTDGGFTFVGIGQGDYTVQNSRPISKRLSLAGIDIQSKPIAGLAIDGAFAHSVESLLLTSANTRRSTSGSAFSLSTEYAPKTDGLLKLEAHAVARSVAADFRAAGRIDDAEYYRRYDQEVGSSSVGRLFEFGATQRVGDRFAITGATGRFSGDDGTASKRWEGGIQTTPVKALHVTYSGERITAQRREVRAFAGQSLPPANALINGVWSRQVASAVWDLGWLKPALALNNERKSNTSGGTAQDGFGFTEWKATVDGKHRGRLSWRSEYTRRLSTVTGGMNASAGPLVTPGLAETFLERIALQNWRTLSATLQLTERQHRDVATGNRSRDHLVDGRVSFSPLRRAITLDARYEASRARSARTAREFVFVGPGRGDFHLDAVTGEFIPDSEGEYSERLQSIGAFTPVIGAKSGFRLHFQPGLFYVSPGSRTGDVLRHLASDTQVDFDTRRKAGSPGGYFTSPLTTLKQDSSLVYGNLSFRQDFSLFPQNRSGSARLRYQRTQLVNNQFTTGGERRFLEEYAIRVRVSATRGTSAELQFARQNRLRGDFGQIQFNILSYQGSATLSHRPRQAMELSLRLVGGRDREQLRHIRTLNFSAIPGATYYFTGKGRTAIEAEMATVQATPTNVFVPFEMAGGRRVGRSARWQGSVDYQIGNNFSLLARYDGRKEPLRPILHTARAEFRAYF